MYDMFSNLYYGIPYLDYYSTVVGLDVRLHRSPDLPSPSEAFTRGAIVETTNPPRTAEP